MSGPLSAAAKASRGRALYRYPVLSLATQVLSVVALGTPAPRWLRKSMPSPNARVRSLAPLPGRSPVCADGYCPLWGSCARPAAGFRCHRRCLQVILRGDEPDAGMINALRLSSTHVTRVLHPVTTRALRLAGMPGITMRSLLQRYARDTMVITSTPLWAS